jgi:XRE family aerobic/anaerobic benzoate catabolism transcriptional regulator
MMTASHNVRVKSAHLTTAVPRTDEVAAADQRFLAAFGRRVRELRQQRSLTRKTLARQAQVSERYLGQLESGDGNVSIILLRRIAAALHVTVNQMLPPEQEEPTLGWRFIALIGLRGAGKTTLGRMLATTLSVPFIELDQEIERELGLPLSEIFTLYGQARYRRTERRCLERVLAEHERAVLAVGGGIVSEEDTFQFLLQHCRTVWLKATPEEHMARVIAQGDLRPMAGNAEAMEDLKRILAGRASLYAKAEATVDTSGQTVEESFGMLQRVLGAAKP